MTTRNSKNKNTSRTTTRSTSSTTKNCNVTKSTSLTATQIAELINEATTAGQKAAATRRMNAYITTRTAEGADATRVEANIRRLCNRLGRG